MNKILKRFLIVNMILIYYGCNSNTLNDLKQECDEIKISFHVWKNERRVKNAFGQ